MSDTIKEFFAVRARFFVRMAQVVFIVGAFGYVVADYWVANFRIGFDHQEITSIENGRCFLIRYSNPTPIRGEIYAFHARDWSPWFSEEDVLVKRVAGLPGDRIVVSGEGVFVNGERVSEYGVMFLELLKRTPESFYREQVVPEGQLFMVGDTETSFDSRYWGFLSVAELIGEASILY